MYGRSIRITHRNAEIQMLKGEWGHSKLHTLLYIYILVTGAQAVHSVARGPSGLSVRL